AFVVSGLIPRRTKKFPQPVYGTDATANVKVHHMRCAPTSVPVCSRSTNRGCSIIVRPFVVDALIRHRARKNFGSGGARRGETSRAVDVQFKTSAACPGRRSGLFAENESRRVANHTRVRCRLVNSVACKEKSHPCGT